MSVVQAEINQLLQESQAILYRLEQLEFYKKYNFTSLFDTADEIAEKRDALHNAVQDLITHQVEKNPQEMDERERELWFTRTSSNLIRINQMMGSVISEIEKMRESL